MYDVAREFQVAAGEQLDVIERARVRSGCQTPRSDGLRLVSNLLRRIPAPANADETRTLAELLAQLVVRTVCTAQPATWIRRRQPTDSARGGPQNLAERARQLLESEYATLTTVRSVADALHCHPATLERAFRERFDESIHRRLCRIRSEHAYRLLVDTDTKIDAMPALLGFGSRAAFYRAIRTFFGTHPRPNPPRGTGHHARDRGGV